MCGHYFFQYRFIQGCIIFSTNLFDKLVVLYFCSFCVYFFCVEFDVIFLNFHNICVIIVFIVGVKCFCSHLLKAICKKMITCHENLITTLNKKTYPREFLRFKNFIYKKKSGYSENEKVCKRNAINKYFFRENLRSGTFILDFRY